MQPRILNQWINLIAVWETHSFITLEFGNQKNPQNSEEPTLWVKHCSTKQDVHVHTVGTLDSCCLQCMNAVWSAHYYKTFAFRIVTMSSLLQKIDFLAYINHLLKIVAIMVMIFTHFYVSYDILSYNFVLSGN